jgi:hypothetical protein
LLTKADLIRCNWFYPFTAAAIRIYNEAGIVIETYEHKDDFKGVVNRPICSSIEQTSQRRPRTLQV